MLVPSLATERVTCPVHVWMFDRSQLAHRPFLLKRFRVAIGEYLHTFTVYYNVISSPFMKHCLH